MAPVHLTNHHKRVLAIDGGGFRGLGALLIIESIMKAVEFRARQHLLPCEVFDLIAGTSTGGLIAILLGRLGLDCSSAIKIYKEMVMSVCGTEKQAFWGKFLNSFDTGLESKAYEDVLADVIRKYTGQADTPMAIPQGSRDAIVHGSTNTFVTVTSDAPSYDNHIHCIRSYPSQITLPPPTRRAWLIREAARGTVASQMFMSPLFISHKHSYRDAGFAGFNSPVALIKREIKELWPHDKLSIVVSIGSDLASLAPPNPHRGWSATDQYKRTFVDQIMENLSPSSHSSEILMANGFNIMRQLITLSVDTEISQMEITEQFPAKDTYVRVNPPLGIANTGLVDCFDANIVESTVNAWLRNQGKNCISDIANSLVERNMEPLTIDQAHLIIPPSPPPDTNLGYNPQLDERRPNTIIGYLKNYHVYFVIDDSGSMHGERWNETREALLEIAEHALEQNVEEIDLTFFNNSSVYRGVRGARNIEAIFAGVDPSGTTPTGATLKKVLDAHIDVLDRTVNTAQYSTIKPLDIIVLTDGVPSDTPKDVLVSAVVRMKQGKHHPNAIGVQIVQIGNDPDAIPALKELMYGDVASIVDSVPFDGKLTPQKLERILLGGLHPNIRAMISI